MMSILNPEERERRQRPLRALPCGWLKAMLKTPEMAQA
jgi:hypothetical protein